MLSFTHIIDYLIANKTKIIDDIEQYIQDELIESEHVSLSIQITTDDRIYHLVSSESDGGPLGLFLNLIDIWVSKRRYRSGCEPYNQAFTSTYHNKSASLILHASQF